MNAIDINQTCSNPKVSPSYISSFARETASIFLTFFLCCMLPIVAVKKRTFFYCATKGFRARKNRPAFLREAVCRKSLSCCFESSLLSELSDWANILQPNWQFRDWKSSIKSSKSKKNRFFSDFWRYRFKQNKPSAPGYNIRMYWPNFWQFVYNKIFLKKLL